ncbi:RNA polymerase sigma factor [Steroidobacter sp.]|uniref:RNA polymerase sigma factor n=1 Tax=Steroidobacter sp. TaxID=1978227 RepID=UPI001A40D8A4|nr:sigma-70 family RNA polymerase sigma factor [Steroidobacter sp.]MBL8269805.1 sigma-70 family RNA polymerase sigma factor [Steroidobacter sp.]
MDQLFREHNQGLLRFLRIKLRDEGDAREVAQEAYVRLLQLDNTAAVSFLRAYLFRIAANLAFDRLSARRRIRVESGTDHAEFEQFTDPFDVERAVLAEEELELFLACMEELPPKCREVFAMHRLRKLSSAQIAAQLQISDRMVRKHIARALIYCRYRLDGLSPQEAMSRIGQDKEKTDE